MLLPASPQATAVPQASEGILAAAAKQRHPHNDACPVNIVTPLTPAR